MKKSLLALAALASVASVAHAEDGVQLYGILDVGVANVTNSQGFADQNSVGFTPVGGQGNSTAASSTKPAQNYGGVTGMFNGGLSDSRWGIKGSEDLGNGRKAYFVLESGINVNTGQLNNFAISRVQNANGGQVTGIDSSLSGQLFNRTAYLGISDAKLGMLEAGRVYSLTFDVIGAYDPMKGSQVFSPIGFSGSYGGALGFTEALREDNAVRYKNKFGDFNVGALYKFGQQASGFGAASGSQFNIGYEKGAFGIQATYQQQKDVLAMTGATFSATNPQGVAGTLYDTNGYAVAGKLQLGKLSSMLNQTTLKAGFQALTRKAPSDQLTGLSQFGYTYASSATGGLLNNLAYYSGNGYQAKIYWAGLDHNFTQNLNVALAYYWVNMPGYTSSASGLAGGAGTTASAAAYSNGYTQGYASLLADYNLSKRTDVYAGVMNVSDTQYTVGTTITAVGMRHKF